MSQRPSPAEGRAAFAALRSTSVSLRVASVDAGRIRSEHVVVEHGALCDGVVALGAHADQRCSVTFEVAGDRVIVRGALRGKVRRGQVLETIDTDHLELALHDQGRLEADGLVLLLQVISPPIARRPPGLPAALRSGATLDARFTAIAMASLLAHFMFVVVLENLDPPFVSAAVLPARTVAFMMDAPERPTLVPPELPTTPDRPDEGEEVARTTTRPSTTSHTTGPRSPGPRGPSVGPPDSARIAREIGTSIAEGLSRIGSIGAGAPSAGSVLEGMSASPIATGGSTLATRGGGGTVATGELGRLGGTPESGPIAEGGGLAATGPVGLVRPPGLIEEPSPGLLDPAAVNRRVRERMSAIRRCYERELREDPTLAGRLEVSFAVQMTGQVDGVRVSEDTVGSPRMAACVTQIFRGLPRFTPGPEDGVARFTYPLVFVLGE